MTGASTSDAPRFLADENFNLAIVAGLRRARPALDILTAPDAGILHLADPGVLAWATTHNRILLSHDMRTMPGHFYRFLAQTPARSPLPRSHAALTEPRNWAGHRGSAGDLGSQLP